MFDSHYDFSIIAKNELLNQEPACRTIYRFEAKNRVYFTVVENFTFGFTAIKF